MASAREMSVGFFEEYLDHRKSYWSNTFQWVLAKIIPRPQERQNLSTNFINRILTVKTPDEKWDLIVDLGKQARIAQAEKEAVHSGGKSYFAQAWDIFLGMFIKDTSLFAKECYAVKACLLPIFKTDHPKEYDQKVQDLQKIVNDKELEMSTFMDNRVSINEKEVERDELFNQLLDLANWEDIKKARINRRFPSSIPSIDIGSLKIPDEFRNQTTLNPDPNIPLVLHPKFNTIFFLSELYTTQRGRRYMELLLKREASKHSQPLDMMNSDFFRSIDPNLSMADLVQQTLQTVIEEKKCDLIVAAKFAEENINQLPGKSKFAYILSEGDLYYVDKDATTCEKFNIAETTLENLRKTLNLENLTLEEKESCKCLIEEMSFDQLKQFALITGQVLKKDNNNNIPKTAKGFGIWKASEPSPQTPEQKKEEKPEVKNTQPHVVHGQHKKK